jgi:hypothetical protein
VTSHVILWPGCSVSSLQTCLSFETDHGICKK